jgi:hypothetical protein
MFYTAPMSRAPVQTRNQPATLSLEIGQWFKANATGWGIVAVPLVVLLVVGATLVRILA